MNPSDGSHQTLPSTWWRDSVDSSARRKKIRQQEIRQERHCRASCWAKHSSACILAWSWCSSQTRWLSREWTKAATWARCGLQLLDCSHSSKSHLQVWLARPTHFYNNFHPDYQWHTTTPANMVCAHRALQTLGAREVRNVTAGHIFVVAVATLVGGLLCTFEHVLSDGTHTGVALKLRRGLSTPRYIFISHQSETLRCRPNWQPVWRCCARLQPTTSMVPEQDGVGFRMTTILSPGFGVRPRPESLAQPITPRWWAYYHWNFLITNLIPQEFIFVIDVIALRHKFPWKFMM